MGHLGSLPLLEAPIAMRPHYTSAWEEEVLRKNLIAEKEFEGEEGIEIDDALVANSNLGCEQACKLLTLISAKAHHQDNPVFVPIRNGKVIEVQIDAADPSVHPAGKAWTEAFYVIA